MRKVIALGLVATLLAPIHGAAAAGTVKVRNCVNIKTDAVRLISNKVLKCKKGEKLLTLEIPDPAPVNGLDGATIISGTIDPLPGIGKIGDVFINTSARWLFGPKTKDGWGDGFSIVSHSGGGGGPKGDKGDAGQTGPQGLIGPTGPQGIQGIQGDSANPVTINGSYADTAALIAAHPTGGVAGEAYLIGSPAFLYVWNVHTNIWDNVGQIGGAKGETGAQGVKGDTGTPGFVPKFGWCYDTTDRPATIANTIYPIACDSTGDNSHGVTFNSTSGAIHVTTSGTYNVAFSSQVTNTNTNAAATISVWLQKYTGGAWVNIDQSNTDVEIARKDTTGRKVLAWNFFISILTTEDVRLAWQSSGSNLILDSSAASGNMPAIPGTILTVNQVG